MKKTLIVMIVSALMLMGCKADSEMSEFQGHGLYFKIISTESGGNVVYDTRTGVEYWNSRGAYNFGTLTLLVDKDGKPLIYEK